MKACGVVRPRCLDGVIAGRVLAQGAFAQVLAAGERGGDHRPERWAGLVASPGLTKAALARCWQGRSPAEVLDTVDRGLAAGGAALDEVMAGVNAEGGLAGQVADGGDRWA